VGAAVLEADSSNILVGKVVVLWDNRQLSSG
jgi:hypothetical protein